MNIQIKLVDDTLPLPAYQTSGAAALDLYSRIDIDVQPHELTLIPLNVVINIPEGHVGLLFARSSLPKKKGLMVANSVGVIDSDFCGDEDEIGLAVYNFTNEVTHVEKGERLAQFMILPIDRVAITQVDKMEAKTRGGFGTTGSK